MNWVFLALSSSCLFAILVIADKWLLSTYLPRLKTFFFLIGIFQIVMAAVILLIEPWHSNPTPYVLTIGLLSALSWCFGVLLMFYGVSRLEVSRVIPITHISPVFVGIMAVMFLKEHLSPLTWIAILVTIGGAILVAMGQGHSKRNNGPPIIYLAVMAGSLLTAIANVTFKYALTGIEFWNITALNSLCAALVFMAVGWSSHTVSDIRLLASSKIGTVVFVLAEIVLAPAAIVLMFAAFSAGPASLVSTVISTRPLFVLIITGLLSTGYLNLLDEPINRKNLPGKLFPILMIVAGVTTITMSQG
jgi:drug/metabolite transporter (DMT)-like permease